MKNELKERINTLVDEADLLSSEIAKKQASLSDTEDVTEGKVITSETFLMNEDLKRVINQITVLYRFTKSNNLDIDWGSEKSRLDYLLENELVYFINKNGRLVPKHTDLISAIRERVTNG